MKKKIFAFLVSIIICCAFTVPVFASQNMANSDGFLESENQDTDSIVQVIDAGGIEADPVYVAEDVEVLPAQEGRYVIDQAGVLTYGEIQMLNDRIASLRDELEFDIVIVTVKGLSPDDRMAYADDFFDYNGYGYGDDYSGALLLVNVQEDNTYISGNSWVSTCGKGIRAYSDDDIQSLGSEITPYLELSDYYYAFDKFIDRTVEEVQGKKNYPLIFGVAIAVGIFGAVFYTKKLKNDLISVREATDANNYLVDNSLYLSQSYDNFLYSTVTRRAKPKESSSSSTHTSSSGRSHGGGGF